MIDLIWSGKVISTVCALTAAAIFLASHGCDGENTIQQISPDFTLPIHTAIEDGGLGEETGTPDIGNLTNE